MVGSVFQVCTFPSTGIVYNRTTQALPCECRFLDPTQTCLPLTYSWNRVQESPGIWLLADSKRTLSHRSEIQGCQNLLLCCMINFEHLPSWSIFRSCNLPYLQNLNFSAIFSVLSINAYYSSTEYNTLCKYIGEKQSQWGITIPRPTVLDPSWHIPFPDRNILWAFPNRAHSSLKIPSPEDLMEKPTFTEITSCRLIPHSYYILTTIM